MNKLIKCLVAVATVANLALLVFLVNDSMMFRKQIGEIQRIRIQLPEDFRKEVADQTIVATKEVASETLARAAGQISEETIRASKANEFALARLTEEVSTNLLSTIRALNMECNRFNATNQAALNDFILHSENHIDEAILSLSDKHNSELSKMGEAVRVSASSLDKLVQEQAERRISKMKDAEAAFELYRSEPTNETAILYLQIAIRKNPSELKYIKTLRSEVERSGLDIGLVQEYQAMLSYCLDETSTDCIADLTAMVKELRADIAELEEENNEADLMADDISRVAELKGLLSSNELVVAFDTNAKQVAERRVEILKELISLDGGFNDYEVACASAELMGFVAKAEEHIDKYLAQARLEIGQANGKAIASESDLREFLNALGATAVSQPIALAQQTVQSLYALDMSMQPTNIANACMNEFSILDSRVQELLRDVDKARAGKISAFVNEMGLDSKKRREMKLTQQLDILDKQGKVISKYIGCISDTEIANELLSKQLEILKEVRELQRNRLKLYQTNSANEMKEIAKLIKQYKDDTWKTKTKKNQAVPLLKRLVKIDPSLLVPEINELYQYEYSQLTTDFNAWIEKENAYEDKAKFMVELEKIEKNKLEDL